ncbi:MAG TPA: hypothetical protein VFE33_04515 [Thermoanaerobaculia bacterium]|nr:hypothetical protein [Thermoanaerobaculia bacterium]
MRHRLPQALSLFFLLAGLPAPALAQPATLVVDLQGPVPPNGERPESSFPMGFQAAGGKLFFTAFEPSTGFEVWASDGTEAGTELLGDLCPGLCSFDVAPMGTLGPLAFWRTSLSEPFRPPQLWRSNGTQAGTFPLSGGGEDLETAPGGIDFNGLLYVLGCTRTLGCGVWRTDGTQAGTRLVLPLLFPGFGGGDQLAFGPLLTAGGKLFAFGGPPAGDETDVWVSNGTPGGSVQIATLPHREDHLFTAAGDHVFFVAEVAGKGEELWVSDGTRAGTRPVSRFVPDLPFGSTVALKAVGNRVYFPADDGVHGTELWTSDGTPRGTRRVTDLPYRLPFARSDATSALSGIAAVGDRVLFAAYDGVRFGLWQTAGDPASTTRLALEIPGDSPLVPVAGTVLFTVPKGLRRQLWATDGTPAGTRFLHPLVSRPVVARGVAYFAATQGFGPVHLWRTDGSPAGTREVSPVPILDLTHRDLEVVALRGRLYFAGEGAYGNELWSSDGTPAGTGMVADLARSGPGSNPHDGVALGDRLLFSAVTDGGLRVWATQGTAASTVPLTPPMDAFGALSQQEVVGGLSFFYRDANREPEGEPAKLWRTDGTPGGTFPLLDVGPRRAGLYAPTAPKLGAGELVRLRAGRRAAGVQPGFGRGKRALAERRHRPGDAEDRDLPGPALGDALPHPGRRDLLHHPGILHPAALANRWDRRRDR